MEYTKIENAEAVRQESLKTEARQKEELAFAAELEVEENKALSLRDLDEDRQDVLTERARITRREANVYIAASELPKEEITEIHKAFLNRCIEHTERNHIQHSAVLQVKAELGEETASYDSILSRFDVSHDLFVKKLNELEGKQTPASQKRATPKQRIVKAK